MKFFKLLSVTLFLCGIHTQMVSAQADRWQQRAEYKMNIDFDVNSHQFKGQQTITYYNNSPDVLDRVFYHLYFNAFQPGSMMDVRSQSVPDPDPRVGSRIGKLKNNQIGYHKVSSLKQDGKPTQFEIVGTILEVELAVPIQPNSSTVLEMTFNSQVPVQIRRSGRDNAEGISYSMTQWYPKLCEYDYQGWHANPYIGREFYGVWGDFDVTISIDRDYIVAASGYLQNPQEIGYGFEKEGTKVKRKGKKLSWHYVAPNVHDFAWGADPDYTHDKLVRKDGTILHFFYQKNDRTEENWAKLPKVMDRAFDYINEHFGQYPYKQYSFIQGGDGGMEYPMATLITGERSFPSLVGVSIHELMHSWYQMVLGTNESLYAWMDEGFTTYASAEINNFLKGEGLMSGRVSENPHIRTTQNFANFALSGIEEPLSIHADHFVSNSAYGTGAYTKGRLFLSQLGYIIGEKALAKTLLDYFEIWKFKHPNDNDFVRVAEKVSGLELDWYREYMVNTTHTVDYGVKSVQEMGGQTRVTLERIGYMPMPMDVMISLKDGTKELYNIPLRIMRGNKPQEDSGVQQKVIEDWPWTHPEYSFNLPVALDKIEKIEIDPSLRMIDVKRENNIYPQE
ncbi:MAG: M1 family metallopeptidase [Saprospiraceae bacterium]|nr:M1 family metallopeptidase [Saprospiraceae bacterium]